MRIVPSCNLGSLGLDGEPSFYTWRWWHSVAGMSLWIVLVLAMVIPRANRTPKTLLILIPVAVVLLEWLVFSGVVGARHSEIQNFGIIARSLAVGSAVLWLLGHRLAGGVWRRTFLRSLGVVLCVVLTGAESLGVASEASLAFTTILAVMMSTLVVAYALAVRGYRSRGDWGYFTFQAAGSLIVCPASILLATPIFLSIGGGTIPPIGTVLEVVILGGLLLGLLVFLAVLPFGILGVSSPFFRRRLLMCVRQSVSNGNDPGNPASSPLET